MDNSVRQFQPFRRHLALEGAIFLIWHPRNHFQTMRRVTHVFFVPAVLGYCHDFPAGVAVRTLGAARQKSLCKIDQSQRGPQKIQKGPGDMERGQYAGHGTGRGRVLEMAEDSTDKWDYEAGIARRFGFAQQLELPIPMPEIKRPPTEAARTG
jgi:hypothetical protein